MSPLGIRHMNRGATILKWSPNGGYAQQWTVRVTEVFWGGAPSNQFTLSFELQEAPISTPAPTAAPTPATTPAPTPSTPPAAVTLSDFALLSSPSGAVLLDPLPANKELAYDVFPRASYSIHVRLSATCSTCKVKFSLNGVFRRQEGVAPYVVSGDRVSPKYVFPLVLNPGAYTLQAQLLNNGAVIDMKTLPFTVSVVTTPTTAPTPAPTPPPTPAPKPQCNRQLVLDASFYNQDHKGIVFPRSGQPDLWVFSDFPARKLYGFDGTSNLVDLGTISNYASIYMVFAGRVFFVLSRCLWWTDGTPNSAQEFPTRICNLHSRIVPFAELNSTHMVVGGPDGDTLKLIQAGTWAITDLGFKTEEYSSMTHAFKTFNNAIFFNEFNRIRVWIDGAPDVFDLSPTGFRGRDSQEVFNAFPAMGYMWFNHRNGIIRHDGVTQGPGEVITGFSVVNWRGNVVADYCLPLAPLPQDQGLLCMGDDGHNLYVSHDGSTFTNITAYDAFEDEYDSIRVQSAHVGNKVIFMGETSPEGAEPWTTDGTPAGTTRLKNIKGDSARFLFHRGSIPTSVRHKVFYYSSSIQRVMFRAEDDNDWKLWSTDGTVEGTCVHCDFDAIGHEIDDDGPVAAFDLNGQLYVTTEKSGQHSMWRINEPWQTN